MCHVVADGVFDSDRGREYTGGQSDGLMDTEEMAESYWKLHTQGKRAWTWEIDLRPYLVFPFEDSELIDLGEMVKMNTHPKGRNVILTSCHMSFF